MHRVPCRRQHTISRERIEKMRSSLYIVAIIVSAIAASVLTPVLAFAADASPSKAICVVVPAEGSSCRGVVTFQSTDDGKVKVTASISGLTANQKHAIHVHEFGDITDLSGKSAGGHFNPENLPHGLPPAANRHAGDLGNLQADGAGKASYELTVDNISIASKNAILGRAIVVHALPDDGGQPTGNAGGRIGFGVIGIAQTTP
jgi:Cu-Zn family superoxide dismutase